MNVAELGQVLLRRWWATVVILIVAAGAAAGVATTIQPVLQSQAVVVLVPPARAADPGLANPFLNLNYSVAQLAGVVSAMLSSDATESTLSLVGATGTYTVSNLTSDNPAFAQLGVQLTIVASSTDPEMARFTARQVVEQARVALQVLQEQQSIAADDRVNLAELSAPGLGVASGNGRIRAAGAVAVVVAAVLLIMLLVIDTLVAARRRRRAAKRAARRDDAQPDGAQPDGASAPDAEAGTEPSAGAGPVTEPAAATEPATAGSRRSAGRQQ
ncbi:MAG TPA: hypothetical protein VLJ59_01145 [Mycobacteriales bacterium]|nr:hypothetical protein [Mycobacteriales bacterium]